MFRIIVRVFAVIGMLFVLSIAATVLAAMHMAEKQPKAPASMILRLDFDEPITETAGASRLPLPVDHDRTPLFDILRAIRIAKNDARVKGIVAHFGSQQPSMSDAQEIRDAIDHFRKSGKFTYAFGSTYGEFGDGSKAYYLATAFQNIWLQPVGTVSLTGMAMQSPFGKSALDKLGVKAAFMQREEYKSFMDMATRDDFAPPVKQNMEGLLADLSSQMSDGIAKSLNMDAAHVKDLMARGPFTDQEALQEKLVTRLGYFDELNDEIDNIAGKDAKGVDAETYLSYTARHQKNLPNAIAIIYGVGEIFDHDSETPSLTGGKTMGADTVADAFDEAADTENVKAIIFRVNSPGGSPAASETVRRAMQHAQKKGKPIFVSMGNLAASGGYWIAMNGDHIMADPATITGSIGVLAGKFTVGDMLKKAGVTMGSLKTTDNAGMWSMADDFTPQQAERMNALLDNTYRAFTTRVAEARHIAPEKMPDLAKGRVWTGAQAKQLGLVDELGGFDKAIDAARKKIGVADNDIVELAVFPQPETPLARMMKLMHTLGVEESALRPILSHLGGVLQMLSPLTINAPVSATLPLSVESIK